MSIEQTKSLSKEFLGLSLNESDLARLASIIEEAIAGFGGNVAIEVQSADGEDTFRSNNPQFFFDEKMPRKISSMRIGCTGERVPLSCRLTISSGYRGGVDLSVDGEDVALVSGLFREIERELESESSLNPKVTRWIHESSILGMLLGFLLALAIFSLFDFSINIMDAVVADFKESTLRSNIAWVGWGFVFVGLFVGGRYFEGLFKRVFPLVRFHGHISNEGKDVRGIMVWVLTAIVLPVVLNVGTSMVGGVVAAAENATQPISQVTNTYMTEPVKEQ